jgi:hypothetical protein
MSSNRMRRTRTSEDTQTRRGGATRTRPWTPKHHRSACSSAVAISQEPWVGGSLLYFLGQFVILFVSARISDVSAMYQLCISVFALSRS